MKTDRHRLAKRRRSRIVAAALCVLLALIVGGAAAQRVSPSSAPGTAMTAGGTASSTALPPVASVVSTATAVSNAISPTIPAATTATPLPAPSPTPTAASSLATLAHLPMLLQMTWQGYKQDFIQQDGRVVDPGRSGVTTSEGQSYALLRAVWMNDRPTFDRVWVWTQHNLQVRRDHLLGYLWGQHTDGQWSILSTNSATDADEDTALALIFASHRWHSHSYVLQARALLRDMWRHEVAYVRGKPYLTAGNWAPTWSKTAIAVNPSYLAPYAYRVFARVDTAHPWMQVVDSAYQVLQACSIAPLDQHTSVDLPPNWCAIVRASGQAAPLRGTALADVYGYDAFRVMWRVALDWIWNREPRAKAYLDKSGFLRSQWWRNKKLFAQYQHDGRALGTNEDAAAYGADSANFVVTAPALAFNIAVDKLLPLFQQHDGVAYWDQRYAYYEQNWVWFGLALIGHQLPNLAAA